MCSLFLPPYFIPRGNSDEVSFSLDFSVMLVNKTHQKFLTRKLQDKITLITDNEFNINSLLRSGLSAALPFSQYLKNPKTF